MAEQRGFRPFEFLRDASRNSPWVLIAVALHVFLIAGAAIFYTVRRAAGRGHVQQDHGAKQTTKNETKNQIAHGWLLWLLVGLEILSLVTLMPSAPAAR